MYNCKSCGVECPSFGNDEGVNPNFPYCVNCRQRINHPYLNSPKIINLPFRVVTDYKFKCQSCGRKYGDLGKLGRHFQKTHMEVPIGYDPNIELKGVKEE